MRKLFVTEFVSLDGVMEAPGGEPDYPHTGWAFDHHDSELESWKLQETRDSDALLLGRVTYEGFAEAWPPRSGEFADKYNSMPKYVASTTLTDPAWENTTVLEGDVPAAVARLKEGEGGPIQVAGSRTLVHTLLENDLVDELVLMVFPVILGSGKRVFPRVDGQADTRAARDGALLHRRRGAQVPSARADGAARAAELAGDRHARLPAALRLRLVEGEIRASLELLEPSPRAETTTPAEKEPRVGVRSTRPIRLRSSRSRPRRGRCRPAPAPRRASGRRTGRSGAARSGRRARARSRARGRC